MKGGEEGKAQWVQGANVVFLEMTEDELWPHPCGPPAWHASTQRRRGRKIAGAGPGWTTMVRPRLTCAL